MRRWRGRCASVFGPREEVDGLWQYLEPHWGPARAVRVHQPLLVSDRLPSTLGVPLDPRVRPARIDEVDLVLPAAEHMFTAEIGYPPYRGNDRGYRASLASLAARGHTYVVVEGGGVVFKTDIGSLALGCAQLQGVWLAPGCGVAGSPCRCWRASSSRSWWARHRSSPCTSTTSTPPPGRRTSASGSVRSGTSRRCSSDGVVG